MGIVAPIEDDPHPAGYARRPPLFKGRCHRPLQRGTLKLNPHGHQHVKRALGIAILDQRRRARIGELEHRGFAFELAGDVEQVA